MRVFKAHNGKVHGVQRYRVFSDTRRNVGTVCGIFRAWSNDVQAKYRDHVIVGAKGSITCKTCRKILELEM